MNIDYISQELFSQFKAIELDYINGSSFIQCQNGEMAKVGDGKHHGVNLRSKTARRCIEDGQPYCADRSDLTPKTCSWACLHLIDGFYHGDYSWSCPGEAQCISRDHICDGKRDCSNGQDEDEKLCTEDFCKNGLLSYDFNETNYTSSEDDHAYFRDDTDLSKMELRSPRYGASFISSACKAYKIEE